MVNTFFLRRGARDREGKTCVWRFAICQMRTRARHRDVSEPHVPLKWCRQCSLVDARLTCTNCFKIKIIVIIYISKDPITCEVTCKLQNKYNKMSKVPLHPRLMESIFRGI